MQRSQFAMLVRPVGLRCVLAVAATVIAGACQAHVTIVSSANQISAQLILPPPSTALDTLFGGTNVFEEADGLVLGSDLDVDIASGGIPGIYHSGDALSPGVIPAGTRISSALVHFDTGGVPVFPVTAKLTVNFDEDIIGVILSDELLDLSDPLVGYAGTTYPAGLDQRGTTTDVGGGDKVTVGTPNNPPRILLLELTIDEVLDQVRVITRSPVPEPATLGLAAIGVTMFGFRRGSRRRSRRHASS